MTFELGLTYGVLKEDETIIIFKFIGGNPPCGIVEGEKVLLDVIMSGGYVRYWEVK